MEAHCDAWMAHMSSPHWLQHEGAARVAHGAAQAELAALADAPGEGVAGHGDRDHVRPTRADELHRPVCVLT